MHFIRNKYLPFFPETATKSVPFDQKSNVGFLICSLVELIVGWKFCAVFCSINTFYIGISWYVEICVDDLETIFHEIDSNLSAIDAGHRSENSVLRKSLLDAVDFHRRVLR